MWRIISQENCGLIITVLIEGVALDEGVRQSCQHIVHAPDADSFASLLSSALPPLLNLCNVHWVVVRGRLEELLSQCVMSALQGGTRGLRRCPDRKKLRNSSRRHCPM